MSLWNQSLNVMEALVDDEIEAFLAVHANDRGIRYINPSQVKAFALNRLPGLYATSELGWQKQWERGKLEFAKPINTAVNQGFAAVHRDPLRYNDALQPPQDEADLALATLSKVFRRNDLSWSNLVEAVHDAITQAEAGGQAWRRSGVRQAVFDWDSNPVHQRN
jgi:hypothetical protein